MFEERSAHYRTLAARLRDTASPTRFAELRSGYLELAARFGRLAARTELRHPVDVVGAVRIEACYLAKPES